MAENLQKLLYKLEKAKFAGELHLRFEAGQVASAELRHYIAASEFTAELPCIDPEKEFELKP